jgi:hypothetical protein
VGRFPEDRYNGENKSLRMASAPHPVHASVAFLRIPDFDSRSVSEQASLKDRAEARARAALAGVPAAERVVLDAADGLALVIFGECSRALDVAQSLGGSEAFLKVGLNYGPLALTSRGSDARVVGDGLTAAAAAARFATPQRLLVTQDFKRALDAYAPQRSAELATAGDFTDTLIRQHSLYTPDTARTKRRRRYAFLTAMGGIAAILLLGVAARLVNPLLFPPSPAVLTLVVKPRGEVFVDGVSQGRSPPITRIEVPAGKHAVAIRNPGSPSLELILNLKAGEETTVTHTFTTIPPRRVSPPEPKPDFWRDLKRKFGGS